MAVKYFFANARIAGARGSAAAEGATLTRRIEVAAGGVVDVDGAVEEGALFGAGVVSLVGALLGPAFERVTGGGDFWLARGDDGERVLG
jgi:hypothetical protein